VVEAYPVRAANVWKRILLYIGGYPVFAFVFACLHWALHRSWQWETMSWAPRSMVTFGQVAYEMFSTEFRIYLGIVLAGHAYFYFVLSQEQERERLRMERALAQSELQVLKNQMQPHFLFNTLHGIKTLVGSDRPRAEQMLQNLSGLLRRSLRRGDTDLVTLAEDLKFAEDYLAIEKMRLGNRLRVEWDVAPDTRNLLVPQLMLQPLLENAIKHGIAPSQSGGCVRFSSRRAAQRLYLEIRNTVCGAEANGSGVGHQNIHARLECLFGTDASLTFNCQDGVAEARVELPALPAVETTSQTAAEQEVRHASVSR
jgi:LytS/YehU family sensor histidine kinase